jgi:hypothetical protein
MGLETDFGEIEGMSGSGGDGSGQTPYPGKEGEEETERARRTDQNG